MPLKPLMLWSSAAALMMGSIAAQAGMVTGTFSGVILASEDYDYESYSADVWDGDVTGQTFTGKVWWSTDFPAAPNPMGEPSYWSNTNQWVGLEFTIAGKTFSTSVNDYPNFQLDGDQTSESVYIQNPDPLNGTTNLYVADDNYYVGSDGDYFTKRANIGVVDQGTNLKGTSLEQAFSYVASGESYSYAYLFLDGSVGGVVTDAMAYMRIDEFHVGPLSASASASVPEPSSLVLAGLGALGLCWRRRQKAQTA